MSLLLSLLFGAVGAFAGALVTGPIAYWVFGSPPYFKFTPRTRRGPKGMIAWAGVAIWFSVTYPMVLGVLVSIASRYLAFWDGIISVPELMITVSEVIAQSPALAFSGGLKYFFTGLSASVIFALGAYIIGRANSYGSTRSLYYLSPAATIVLCICVLLALIATPELVLARIGGLK
jgi:hypothetical protein